MTDVPGTEVKPDPYQLSRTELLSFVELDLWNRFQSKLWKIITAVITGATIAGLLGVPVYIKNEINQRLQQRTAEFENRTREIFAYSKLLALLSIKYEEALASLQSDTYRLMAALELQDAQNSKKGSRPTFDTRSHRLAALMSLTDFDGVVDGDLFGEEALSISESEGKNIVLPPLIISHESRGISGSGGYQEPHPVRDGSIGGAIRDIKYRIVALAALRRAIVEVRQQLLLVGGMTSLDGKIEAVRTEMLESETFSKTFEKHVNEVSVKFLKPKEEEEFTRLKDLYLMGYAVRMPALSPPPPAKHEQFTAAKLQ